MSLSLRLDIVYYSNNRVIQILRVLEIEKTDNVRRPYIRQLLGAMLQAGGSKTGEAGYFVELTIFCSR